MLWVCISDERKEKCELVMGALAAGWGDPPATLIHSHPPDDGEPIAVWGQIYLIERVLPKAIEQKRPFWHVDNGYYMPAAREAARTGYHRVCYRGMSPVFLKDAPAPRCEALRPRLKSWRKWGEHILIALPGEEYGRAMGLNMRDWIRDSVSSVRKHTDRPITLRDRKSDKPLADDLHNCWALVTHSSNVAVDAVLAGIPVFVAPTNPAAPVGNLDIAQINTPKMFDRSFWWRSLMFQQFTRAEMYSGLAYRHLQVVREQVDGLTGGIQNQHRKMG